MCVCEYYYLGYIASTMKLVSSLFEVAGVHTC